MYKGACSRECSQSESERGRDAIAHDAGGVCLSSHGEAVKGDLYAFRVSENHSYPGLYVGPHWEDMCFFLRLDMGHLDDPAPKEPYRRLEEFPESGDDGAADVDKFYCKLVPQHSPESESGGKAQGLWDLARAVPEIVPVTRLQRMPGFEWKCENFEKLREFLNQLRRSRYSRTNYGHRQSYDMDSENPKAVKEAVVGRFYGVQMCVFETESPGKREKPRPCLVMKTFAKNQSEDNQSKDNQSKGKVLVLPVTSFSKRIVDRKGIERIEFQTLEEVFGEEVHIASKYFIPVVYPSDSDKAALNSNFERTHVLVTPRLKNDTGYICAFEHILEVEDIWMLDDLDDPDGKHKCRSEVDKEGFHHVCEVVKNIDFDGHATLRSGGQSGSRGGRRGRRGGGNRGGRGVGSGGGHHGGNGGGNRGGGGGGGNRGGGGGGNCSGNGGGNRGGSGGGRRGGCGGRGGGGRGGGRGGGGRQHGGRQLDRNGSEDTRELSEQENIGGGVKDKGSERGSVGGSVGSEEIEINCPSNYHHQVYEVYELTEDLDDLDWSWDGVSPWIPLCNQQTDKLPHRFATNVIQTLDKQVLERLNQHMEYHLEKNIPNRNLPKVKEGTTSKIPLKTLLENSFEMLMNLMMEVIDTKDIDTDILHEVMKDLIETFHDLAEDEVNLPISKDDLEIALKREGKIPWNITDDKLVKCIKWENVECFNEGGDHPFLNALSEENWDNDDLYLECDDDEEKEKFLLKICFWTNVKVTQLIIKSPPEKGPTTLKLFVNKPHMGYGDEESITQTIELKPENLEGVPVMLEAWKFQWVESLQVRAEGLEGETVQVTKFALIGSTKLTTDASKLKRQCSMAYVLTQFGDSIK